MKPRATFHKKDLVVASTCVAFLLISLGAIGGRSRARAKEIVCLSNLHQWGSVFQMYTDDNDGYFSTGIVISAGWHRGQWIIGLRPYVEANTNLLRCPEATRLHPDRYGWGGPFNTYKMPMAGTGGTIGGEEPSYGANCWLYNPPQGVAAIQGRPTEWNWRTAAVQGADSIPVFADSMYRGGGPRESGTQGYPPQYDGQWLGYGREMMHFCINRHNGAIDVLFMDWSAGKIGLKQLWTLKWHRQFNTAGPWTGTGGAHPSDWPAWMSDFRDY